MTASTERASHPERSEGGHAGSCPLRFAQGDSSLSAPAFAYAPISAPASASMPAFPSARSRALQHALDRIHTRYGARALSSGATRLLTR
jgi:hypothetical protein